MTRSLLAALVLASSPVFAQFASQQEQDQYVGAVRVHSLARAALGAALAPGAPKCATKWDKATLESGKLVLACAGGGQVSIDFHRRKGAPKADAVKEEDHFTLDAKGRLMSETARKPYKPEEIAQIVDLVNKGYFADKDAAQKGLAAMGADVNRTEAWFGLVRMLENGILAHPDVEECSEHQPTPLLGKMEKREDKLVFSCLNDKPGEPILRFEMDLPPGLRAVNPPGGLKAPLGVVVVDTMGEPGVLQFFDEDHEGMLMRMAFEDLQKHKLLPPAPPSLSQKEKDRRVVGHTVREHNKEH